MLNPAFVGAPTSTRHYFLGAKGEPGEGDASRLWWGRGAEVLGLAGREVEGRAFLALLRGWGFPGVCVGRRLEGQWRHRPGLDLTFSAPKSISVAALVEGDHRWIAWHEAAVTAALERLESRHLFAPGLPDRIRGGGVVVARFVHRLSRAGDPQLHTHAVAMNLLHHPDGHWSPLDPWPILRLQKVLGALYRSELAARARILGWELRPRRHGFECARYPETLLAAWSSRARTVEAALRRLGLDRERASSRRKNYIARRTRAPKQTLDLVALRKGWLDLASTLDPGWSARAPSQAYDPKLGRVDLLRESCESGRLIARLAVAAGRRGLTYREVEIWETIYRDGLGRSPLARLERTWMVAQAAGLFRHEPSPHGRVPRTGLDGWLRCEVHESWIERFRALAPKTVMIQEERARSSARRGPDYAQLLRHLVTARDLGRTPLLTECVVRSAAYDCRPWRDLLRQAGIRTHDYRAPALTHRTVAQDLRRVGPNVAWEPPLP